MGNKSVRRCPRCGRDTVVYDSREDPFNGKIVRRRKCPGCGYRYVTNEIYIGAVQEREKCGR